MSYNYPSLSSFQLTASRGGRHALSLNSADQLKLSTHGLTRRPTQVGQNLEAGYPLSTHGLTRRPTEVNSNLGGVAAPFNSRPHEEADELEDLIREIEKILSTHGLTRRPTWGGYLATYLGLLSTHGLTRRPTAVQCQRTPQERTFNSRPHEEADAAFHTMNYQKFYLSTHGLTRRPTIL